MFTPHQFFALVVRLFAAWLLLTAGQIVLVTYAVQRGGQDNAAMSYAVAGLYALVALLLWVFPQAVSRKLLPKAGADSVAAGVAGDTGAIAFIGAGLLIIALKALTPLANYLSLLTMLLLSGQSSRLSTAAMHIDGIIAIAMMLIGLILIAKSRLLACWVLRR